MSRRWLWSIVMTVTSLWWAIIIVWSMSWMLAMVMSLIPTTTPIIVTMVTPLIMRVELMAVVVVIAAHEVGTHITRINNYNNSLLWTSINRAIICHCTTHCHHR